MISDGRHCGESLCDSHTMRLILDIAEEIYLSHLDLRRS